MKIELNFLTREKVEFLRPFKSQLLLFLIIFFKFQMFLMQNRPLYLKIYLSLLNANFRRKHLIYY